MTAALVVGTRPQLIKAAALLPALPGVSLVDTGQHWDLASGLYAELGLPRPYSLAVGSSDVAAMIRSILPVLGRLEPSMVVVIGDTNSTLAATVAATSIGIPVAHVEAGVRCFDRTLPEERNRIEVDRLSRWRLVPDPAAVWNLAAEGITDGVEVVGDVMADAVALYLDHSGDPEPYVFATIHRAANRTPRAMAAWLRILEDITLPVVLALHPGTEAAMTAAGLTLPSGVTNVGPVGYRRSLSLQYHATAVVTDSGGIERESSWLGTPVVVLRAHTEWPELVTAGRSAHVGLSRRAAAHALSTLKRQPEAIPTGAAWRIATALRPAVARVA